MRHLFLLSLAIILSQTVLAQPTQKVVLRTHAFGME